jgi:prevent-host-death family protein
MPNIKSSADLRNNYNEISTICHKYGEPVFITKNGKGDLAVMSIETYEKIVGKFELYGLISDGLEDIKNGNTRPVSEALSDLRGRRKR